MLRNPQFEIDLVLDFLVNFLIYSSFLFFLYSDWVSLCSLYYILLPYKKNCENENICLFRLKSLTQSKGANQRINHVVWIICTMRNKLFSIKKDCRWITGRNLISYCFRSEFDRLHRTLIFHYYIGRNTRQVFR